MFVLYFSLDLSKLNTIGLIKMLQSIKIQLSNNLKEIYS